MSTFQIKNISIFTVKVLGIDLAPKAKLDLLSKFTESEIKASLLGKQLFYMFMGRVITTIEPKEFLNLNLSQDEFAFLSSTGIMQGYMGLDLLKYPFVCDKDGNLLVKAV